MTPFTLHLLRHGAPTPPGRLTGRTDVEPTEAGIAACVRQAATLDAERLVASDLRRAREAAAAIADPGSLVITIDPRWRELDFGEWDGLEAEAVDPAALGRFWDDPDAHPPPGGERWSSLVARVESAIADLASASTLVVTHGGAIRAALHVLCGFDLRQLWAFDLPYAAMVSLRIWPGRPPTAQITAIHP